MTVLRSPLTGDPLREDTTHSLSDGRDRWPVLDGVPYLRAGRDEVRDAALRALDDGRRGDALAVLLADQDDWWDGAPPAPEQLREADRAATLREAVDRLGLGRVGDYFLHRDHDPSGLAVLALTAAHPPAGRPVVDLACGAGHLLRHLAGHGHRRLTGLDVVFAKLWLARRFVLPEAAAATLVCADLARPWPVSPTGEATYVTCHDALYFLAEPAAVLDGASRLADDGGAVLAAHCHNAAHPAATAGHPRAPEAWAALLPGACCYAEEELTTATLEHRAPRPADTVELADTEAVALARDGTPGASDPALLDPPAGAGLQVNPLYLDGHRHWPGDRWADEYGTRAATYLPEVLPGPAPSPGDPRREAWRRARLLVDLPERW